MKNNMTREEILNRVAYLKNKKGMSAFQLSRELGHARTYFYRLQTNKMVLNLETLLEMLEIVDVTTEEFFYGDIDNYEEDMKFLKAYKMLSEEERKSIQTILNMKQMPARNK